MPGSTPRLASLRGDGDGAPWIHVALDPTPDNGTTAATYEALRMGLPVIVLEGGSTRRPRLAEPRRSLRPTLAASPLLDAPGYAERFWAALRGTWRDWCATQRARE